MSNEDRLEGLLVNAIKDQTRTLVVPLIITVVLINVFISIWLFSKK